MRRRKQGGERERESSLRKSARSQWRKMRNEWAVGLKGAASSYSSGYNGHLQSGSSQAGWLAVSQCDVSHLC